jgi:hypothetical protein
MRGRIVFVGFIVSVVLFFVFTFAPSVFFNLLKPTFCSTGQLIEQGTSYRDSSNVERSATVTQCLQPDGTTVFINDPMVLSSFGIILVPFIFSLMLSFILTPFIQRRAN